MYTYDVAVDEDVVEFVETVDISRSKEILKKRARAAKRTDQSRMSGVSNLSEIALEDDDTEVC
jgi:hypothetical protein